ncbi:MAG TPA: hypothetical protein VFQ80_04480 [Thermomicrobiales bacterium]|nr:hypothetical protein [Thermomicrobiales bacterium]
MRGDAAVSGRWRRALTILLALAAILIPTAPSAQAQTPSTAPLRCQVGVYLIDLYNLDYVANTFTADLWLWSVCPTAAYKPLDALEFVNADAVATHLQTFAPAGGKFWATRNISGVFREDWDLRHFPFDRHTLTIVLDAGDQDADQFQFAPDATDSTYDRHLTVPGWRIVGFRLIASVENLGSTFGNPTLPAGAGSRSSRLTVETDLVRTQLSTFFQLTAVVYAAFVLSVLSYFVQLDLTAALEVQMGLLAGAVFATAVNLSTASAALGHQNGLTLIDEIHLVVLLFILVAAFLAVGSHIARDRGQRPARIVRFNHIAGVVTTLAFLALNLALLLSTARTS